MSESPMGEGQKREGGDDDPGTARRRDDALRRALGMRPGHKHMKKRVHGEDADKGTDTNKGEGKR